MNKYLLIPFCILSISKICAQTNTFPPAGNTGIGTTTPQDLLEIRTGTLRKGITLTGDGNSDAYNDIMFSINDKSAVSSSKPYAWVLSHRKDGYFSNTPNGESSLEFYAIRSAGYYAPMSFKSNGDVIIVSSKNAAVGNVGIGTTDPREKLSVNGKIRAHEIKVETTNWPDYVFAKDYQLPSLKETEKHIKDKGHLPDIPSAEEVKANGVDLGEMNAKLLKKIEELTLHLIGQNKQIERQEARNEKLEDQVEFLMKKFKTLKIEN